MLQSPMDTDEESRYAMEDAEREWEREAMESQRRSRNSSFLNAAGNLMRTVSVSGDQCDHVTMLLGVSCVDIDSSEENVYSVTVSLFG